MKDIEIKNLNRRIKSKPECSLLETLVAEKIEIAHSCGGMGTCGTCRVLILEPNQLSPIRNEIESEIAIDRGFTANERLSCQIHALEGLVIEIPEK